MNLFLVILLFAGDVVVSSPTQCNVCYERDGAVCTANQRNQTCALDIESLGTTHCGSAAIIYRDYPNDDVTSGFFRGCIDCADKKAACFNLGGYLKADKGQILLQCEIQCCTTSNCNTQIPTLSVAKHGITVFTPNVNGPAQCQTCFTDDKASCSENRNTQNCAKDRHSLGTTHCGSATIKYRQKGSENVEDGFFRGCIDCADKKAACAAIGGYLKRRRITTLAECAIECCTGDNCNDEALANQPTCNFCKEISAAKCIGELRLQPCASDRSSLGTSHCASMVGKVRGMRGGVGEAFYRGCIDCADKKTACYALGGYLKGSDSKDAVSLLQCEIECCKGSQCNTQFPTLSPDAISVFTTAASGPKQCNMCLQSNATGCSKNQQTQICATSPNSLGASHCGTAVGKYRDRQGNVVNVFIRGCINCADKKAACAAVGGFLKVSKRLTQLECEIECCTGDNCNTQIPILPKGGSPAPKANDAASYKGHRVLWSGVLALVPVLADIMYSMYYF